jgi:NAD(P)-dependent dehydrogenase (short-subunit alcohol dehydrogenase family)
MSPSKRALVVGGAKGIGLATVRVLRDKGYQVTVWDNDEVALSRHNSTDRRTVDIADRNAVKREIASLKDAGVVFYAAVVTAGVHATSPVEIMTDDMLDRVTDINFLSHAKLVRDIIPLMQKGGRIIGVSSIAATVGIPMSAAYSASKAALELFYETLATELRYRSISALIVNPGNVNTGFNETGNAVMTDAPPELGLAHRKVLESIHSRHGMEPNDVAKVIAKAVSATTPAFYYLVGSNAKRAALAKRILGHDGAMYFLRRHFGFL